MTSFLADPAQQMPNFERFDQEIADGILRSGGALPGLPGYLGITHSEVSAGRMAATLGVRDELLNPFGTLHGGVLAAFCDHMLAVLYPVIPRGSWAATTEFKLNYLAPVRTGTVTAISEIISITKRTAVVRIEVTNENRLVCAAQGTVLIVAPRADS